MREAGVCALVWGCMNECKHVGQSPVLGISSDAIQLVLGGWVLSLGLELTDGVRLGGLASEGQRSCLHLPSPEVMYRCHYGFVSGRFWASNSGPYAWGTGTLSTELSRQPHWRMFNIHIKGQPHASVRWHGIPLATFHHFSQRVVHWWMFKLFHILWSNILKEISARF